MLLYRIAPDGFFAARTGEGETRFLYSDPLERDPGAWKFGRRTDLERHRLLAPAAPGKVVGIGRNYRAHAEELGNPVPAEPVLFLKSPGAVIGPGVPVVLPPESGRVEHEGEIAVVMARTLRRADAGEARAAVLGVTAACDVTARDLQRRDPTFARAKSFDSFCPLGPAIRIGADLDDLEVICRVNGEERQRGHSRDMLFSIAELVAYVSRMMTLEPWDVILTGTPAGVGPLADGDRLEVEIPGVGVLESPVETWRGSPGP